MRFRGEVWGVKCYNGAWDSKTQRLFNDHEKRLKRLKKLIPDAHCTYFPMEEYHQIWSGNKPISGKSDNEYELVADFLDELEAAENKPRAS